VDFKVYASGTGTAIYYVFGVAVPVPMSRTDVEQLIEELFDSRSCEQIMRQYQRNLIAADVAPAGSGA